MLYDIIITIIIYEKKIIIIILLLVMTYDYISRIDVYCYVIEYYFCYLSNLIYIILYHNIIIYYRTWSILIISYKLNFFFFT